LREIKSSAAALRYIKGLAAFEELFGLKRQADSVRTSRPNQAEEARSRQRQLGSLTRKGISGSATDGELLLRRHIPKAQAR